MNCRLFVKLLDDYLDGTLPEAMKMPVDGHLEHCERCLAMLNGQRKLSTSMSGLLATTTGGLTLTPDVQQNIVDAMRETEVEEPLFGSLPYQDMMKLFEELSFPERIRRVLHGLKQPHETGEYKWARLQVLRLSAPAAGILVPALALLIATIIVALEPARDRAVQVNIKEESLKEELKEPEDIPEPEIQPPEPTEIVQVS